VTSPGDSGASDHEVTDDAACWREAHRLRGAHKGWVIIWLAPAREYRAYRRLPGARRDTALAAPTPQALAAAIVQAQQSAPRAGHRQGGQP
jgi:hypothetical protein